MNLDEIIDKRYSVRKFKQDKIPDDLIKKIVNAGRLAPTGNNAQPQKFYIINSDEGRKKLKENNIFKQEFVYNAPVIIICVGNPDSYPSVEGDNSVRAIRDVSIASAFMVLKATELGLGTCYVGWVNKDKVKEVFNITERYTIPYIIALGFPDIEQHDRKRKPLEEFYEEI